MAPRGAGPGPGRAWWLAALLLATLGHVACTSNMPCELCPRCPPPPARCRYQGSVARDEHFYMLDDVINIKLSYSGAYLTLWCNETAGVSLTSASLPRFADTRRVSRVFLRGCAPPSAPYARALAALNVTAADRLELQLPPGAALLEHHFQNLSVTILALTALDQKSPPLPLPSGLLQPLEQSLQQLQLQDVPGSALQLPSSLRLLLAYFAGAGALLAAPQLSRLPAMRELYVRDPALTSLPQVHAASPLRKLTLVAPLTSLPSLKNIEIFEIRGAQNLTVIEECEGLRELSVSYFNASPIPARWVSACRELRELTVTCAGLWRCGAGAALAVDGGALGPAPALRRLRVTGCAVAELPRDLLLGARGLTTLNLSNNCISSLESDSLSLLMAMEYLDLSQNQLTSSSVGAALESLPESLVTLRLGNNRLGSLCGGGGAALRGGTLSRLRRLTQLKILSLPNTNATKICDDWRRNMHALEKIDLSGNQIKELRFQELQQWTRRANVSVTVEMMGNPLKVELTAEDYRALMTQDHDDAPKVRYRTGRASPGACAETLLWLARALRPPSRLRAAFQPRLQCVTQTNKTTVLENLPDEAFVLDLTEEEFCPSNCSCVWRGDNTTRVRCSTVPAVTSDLPADTLISPRMSPGLLRLTSPALPAAARTLLDVSGSQLDKLDAALLLPVYTDLNLSDNSLSSLDAATLQSLLGATAAGLRRVMLAGNPLACGCDQRHMVTKLQAHKDQIVDYERVRCSNGTLLLEVSPSWCVGGGGVWVAALSAGAALLLLMAAAALAIARTSTRIRVKAFLIARGLCLRWVGTLDDDDDDHKYEYDVFLSFSHHDADVAEQLADVLESGPRPLRVCLHYRDWRPGDWIPAQIARSVSVSRRTVVVLSEQFVRSGWARAELREAHAAALRAAGGAPRLLVVVLGAAPPPGLDPELQHYVQTHTYVRWGEPAFWPKLRRALPRPRDPPAAPHPALPAAASNPALPAAVQHPALPAATQHPAIPAAAPHPALPASIPDPTLSIAAQHPALPPAYITLPPQVPHPKPEIPTAPASVQTSPCA